MTIGTLETYGPVVVDGLSNGATQGLKVVTQIVITDHQRLLGVTLVPQIAHAQRGSIGSVQTVIVVTQRLQAVLATAYKAATNGRSRAK